MASSTRFAVAVHLLTLMAADRRKPLASEILAGSVGTNPAVIRRLLSMLARAGLTTAQLGKGGGAMLAKGPKKITLLEVYRAVEEPGLVLMHRTPPNPNCPVGAHVRPALQHVAEDAEKAFEAALEKVTLKQIAKEIAAQNAAAKNAA